MPGTFQLTLDTTGPQGVALVLDAGNPAYSTDNVVDAIATTTDPDTTGYQVKLWGDVAGVPDEATAVWQTLTSSLAVTLSAGDGTKTVTARLRDDVLNESATASDTILVDTTAPVVSIVTGPTPSKVSKIAPADDSSVQWSSDSDFDLYSVRVVPATSSDHTAGTEIPTTAGSTNTSGGAGTAGTPVTTVIHGADLEAASAGDGDKIVKVFVREAASGYWSV